MSGKEEKEDLLILETTTVLILLNLTWDSVYYISDIIQKLELSSQNKTLLIDKYAPRKRRKIISKP